MTFLLRVVRGQAVRVVQVTKHLYNSYHNSWREGRGGWDIAKKCH